MVTVVMALAKLKKETYKCAQKKKEERKQAVSTFVIEYPMYHESDKYTN